MRIAQTDLRGLMVFRAIVEHDGFTGAQLALGMSQSTISFHLKALEERLGFDLCHRGRGGFRLTQRGRDVYDASKGLIGSVSTFESRLGELRNQVVGTIRLGIVDTTITDPLSPVSRAIGVCMSQEGRPQIEVCVSHPRILAAELEKGGIDIAITPHTEFLGKFESVPLYREYSTLYCGTTHPLFSGKKKLSIKEVAKHDFVIRPYANKKDLTFFKNANVRAYASNMEAQAMFILSGKVIGYLPEHYAKAWVSASEMKPLVSPQTRISSQFLVVMSPSVEPTPLLKMFVSQLRERS
jgi:DNA-binding transcriptional LysR family regulator